MRLVRNTKPNSSEVSGALRLKWLECSSRHATHLGQNRKNYVTSYSTQYNAIAIDYDGTLISLRNRGAPPSKRIMLLLANSVENGIPVVIITGRGRSLLSLVPRFSKFDQNLVFYATYNGTEMYRGRSRTPVILRNFDLRPIFHRLQNNHDLNRLIRRLTLNRRSIQLIPRNKSRPYMDSICRMLEGFVPSNLIARNSGYSIDVFPRTTNKDYCTQTVQKVLGKDLRYLRIGDQGHEYGNDFELLNHVGGFSVGTISCKPTGCFPVVDKSGRTIVGVEGTRYLLEAFQITKSQMPSD